MARFFAKSEEKEILRAQEDMTLGVKRSGARNLP